MLPASRRSSPLEFVHPEEVNRLANCTSRWLSFIVLPLSRLHFCQCGRVHPIQGEAAGIVGLLVDRIRPCSDCGYFCNLDLFQLATSMMTRRWSVRPESLYYSLLTAYMQFCTLFCTVDWSTHSGDITMHMPGPRMSGVHVCILWRRMVHPDILQRTALYGCVTFLGSRIVIIFLMALHSLALHRMSV